MKFNVFLLGFFVVVIALGTGFFVLGRGLWTRAKRIGELAKSWPTTPGTVTASRYLTQTTSQEGGVDEQTYYYIAYRYTVSGKQYSQNVKVFQESLFKEMQQQYPLNATAQVHYDPARPRRSTVDLRLLDEGKSWAIVCYILAAICVLLLAIAIYGTIRS